MQMSGQLHASTTLPSERASSTVRLERLTASLDPSEMKKRNLSLPVVEIWLLRRSSHSLVTIPTELSEGRGKTPWRILSLINTNGSNATWRTLLWSGHANLCFYCHVLSTVITALECNMCCWKNVCIISITRSQWEDATGDCERLIE